MAGDWIKMRCDLATDPAVIQIASDLNLDEDTVVGKLHRLWSWANQQTKNGNACVTHVFVNRFLRTEGFAEAMARAQKLLAQAGKYPLPAQEMPPPFGTLPVGAPPPLPPVPPGPTPPSPGWVLYPEKQSWVLYGSDGTIHESIPVK